MFLALSKRMIFENTLNPTDRCLLDEALDGFVPDRIIDIHGHLHAARYCASEERTGDLQTDKSFADYRRSMDMLLPGRRLEGALLFPFPMRHCDRLGLNAWMFSEIKFQDHPVTKGLALTAPGDSPEVFESWMRNGDCVGLKPYHYYADCADSLQAGIEEFAPEWMWELCHRYEGILMLHLARDGAVSDPGNQEAILRLCAKYPGCKLILPHIARSFNFRTARGLQQLTKIPNLYVDTSSITESEGMRIALDLLGPERVLFGTDYPVSSLRAHCATAGATFHWFYAEEINEPRLTWVGIESLLSLRRACEQVGLQHSDVERIFWGNAENLLRRKSSGSHASSL